MRRLGVITQCSIHHVLFGSVDVLPKLSDDLNNGLATEGYGRIFKENSPYSSASALAMPPLTIPCIAPAFLSSRISERKNGRGIITFLCVGSFLKTPKMNLHCPRWIPINDRDSEAPDPRVI